MENDYTPRNFLIRRFSSFVFAVVLTLMTLSFANAQSCPDPGGGATEIRLNTDQLVENYYPGAVPAGKSGVGKNTVGYLRAVGSVTTYSKRVRTIHPELPGSQGLGYVTLKYEILTLNRPNAKIKIYRGVDETGTLVKEIDSGNSASYLGTSDSYVGPVTVTFESPTTSSAALEIEIKFMTGDQLISSTCLGYSAAVWTAFMTPNSYTFIDDLRDNVTFAGTPICVAYFNSDRQFVSSQVSFCVDQVRKAVGVGHYQYPGQVIFTKEPNYDIDRSGTFDDVDRLKMARVVWMLANAPTAVTRTNLQNMEGSIWHALGSDYASSYTALYNGALVAVPDLPTPAEPNFSITAPASPVAAHSPAVFTVNFSLPAGYDPNDYGTGSQQLKLVVPAGVTIANVSGPATYAGGVLTFASLPASVSITAVSSTSQIASLKVVYEKTGFWNVYNLDVFKPCDVGGGVVSQDFVGLNMGDITYPFREASATWLAPNTYTISSLVPAPMLACNTGVVQYTFSAINNGPSATAAGENIVITLPKPIVFTGAVTGISNFPSGALPTPTSDATNNYYTWTLPAGVASGATISFSVSIGTNQPELLSCGTLPIKEVISYTCVSGDPSCSGDPVIEGENNSTVLTIVKPQLNITGFTAAQNAPGTLSGTFTVGNSSSDAGLGMPQSGTLTIYKDVNNNGVIDAGDTEIGMQNVSIDQGATQTINYNITTTYQGDLCPALVKLEVACACSNPMVFVYTGCNVPLPVKLIAFDAHQEGNTVNLKWTTSSEVNSKGFEIEHSANASNWSKIGFVPSQSLGAGNASRLDYIFTDAAPFKGTSYYRLKMVDLDGTYAYSQIKSLRMDDGAMQKLIAYPNPVVNGKLMIDLSVAGSYRAEVYNLAGIRVLQHNLGNARELNVGTLVAGMYVLRIVSEGGEIQTSTFVVK